MNANDATAKAGSSWPPAALLLGLPSVFFVLAHLIAAVGGLPESLDFAIPGARACRLSLL
jgi:hypothetical protein